LRGQTIVVALKTLVDILSLKYGEFSAQYRGGLGTAKGVVLIHTQYTEYGLGSVTIGLPVLVGKLIDGYTVEYKGYSIKYEGKPQDLLLSSSLSSTDVDGYRVYILPKGLRASNGRPLLRPVWVEVQSFAVGYHKWSEKWQLRVHVEGLFGMVDKTITIAVDTE
jgi:hypothetical protein